SARNEVGSVLLISDVPGQRRGAAASPDDLPDQVVEQGLTASADDDRCAFRGKQFSGRMAYAGARPGNDSNLVLELIHAGVSPLMGRETVPPAPRSRHPASCDAIVE